MATLLFGCASSEKTEQQPKHRNVAVQMYTFNKFTLEEAVNKVKDLGLDGVECYPKQRLSDKFPGVLTNQYMTEEQKAFMKKLFKDANLKLVSFAVAYANNEKEIEDLCKFVKEFGCDRVLTECPVGSFPRLGKGRQKVRRDNGHPQPQRPEQILEPRVYFPARERL